MEDIPKPFFEHLEEFRIRLIKCAIVLLIGTVVGYCFVEPLLTFLARPVGGFIFLQPTEAFFARFKVAFGIGVLLSFPVFIFQIWKFILLALTPSEKKLIFWILPTSYSLFLFGLFFGFFVLVPTGTKLLLSYGSDTVLPALSISFYINFVGTICFVLGLLFQMPLISFFVAKFGLIREGYLSEKRRMAILIIYITSALLTPGPDPVTAILLAVPTYILFESSILTAKLAR